jgi:transglutaminase-like putative cysteine protease
MMRYFVRHSTVYEYGGDVAHSHHLLHLKPRELSHQRCLEHALELEPEPGVRHEDVDAFGNPMARLEYDRAHDRLSVVAQMRVEVNGRAASDLAATEAWELVRGRLGYRATPPRADDLEACRFRMQSDHVAIKQEFAEYALRCFEPGMPMGAAAQALMHLIRRDLKYQPGSTTNRTSIAEVLKNRRGVCQDFAHLMIGALRSNGLAARYVSGYVRTERQDGAMALGGDASHAWVSVYCPPLGWVDFDPTNDRLADEDHVTLAWGRDFGDVSPLRGMIVGGGRHKLRVDVRIQPLEPLSPGSRDNGR